MTELSFLIDLLLNHKLPKATQTAIKERIQEVESQYAKPSMPFPARLSVIQGQAPSMAAAIASMEAEKMGEVPLPVVPIVAINHQGATTPTAARALMDRNKKIVQAISGKEEPGQTSPRKF